MTRPALYGELAQYYDRIYGGKAYAQEVSELLAVARRALGRTPLTLLDVGCGTGRHLEYFARKLDVAGIDASPAMLRVARERLGPRTALARGDMRTFRLGRSFDVVVCLFSAIGYLTRRADRDRAIANFYRHLNPSGVVMVEGWVLPSRWRGDSLHLNTYDGAEAKIVRLSRSTRRGMRSTIDMHYLVGEPGRAIRYVVETHLNALVEPSEMLGSFRRAGFRARVILSSRWRDRGLYVGVRPGVARNTPASAHPGPRRRGRPGPSAAGRDGNAP